MAEKEVFSKAPLKEVICEIRFPTSMSAACRRDEFYNLIKEEYPEIFLPKLSFEQNPFAQPSQYLSKDRTKRITISSEAFSFSTINYESFKVFSNEISKLFKIFFNKNKIVTINKIGFRYINHIPVERSDNKINLKSYLNFEFSLPDSLNRHLLKFFQTSFFVELKKETSGIRVSISNRKDNEGKENIILDFDLISLEKIGIKEVDKYIGSYHAKIEEIFLNILAEEYKKYIR